VPLFEYRISNKEFRIKKYLFSFFTSTFIIPCSIFCGSKTLTKLILLKKLKSYDSLKNEFIIKVLKMGVSSQKLDKVVFLDRI